MNCIGTQCLDISHVVVCIMDLIGSVIAANPCPPLPLQSMRIDPETDKSMVRFLNTHHILMQSYAFAMQRDNPDENLIRKITQTELTRVFMTVFANTSEPPDPEKLYAAAGKFTREYLHSFLPKMRIPDARFAPYDEIARSTSKNNPIVYGTCEHLAGLMYYDERNVGEDDTVVEQRPYADILTSLKDLPYSTLLCMYADVHRERMLIAGSGGTIETVDE